MLKMKEKVKKVVSKNALTSKISLTPNQLHEAITKKAQEIYEKSGRIPGRDLTNWLEAERWVKGTMLV